MLIMNILVTNKINIQSAPYKKKFLNINLLNGCHTGQQSHEEVTFQNIFMNRQYKTVNMFGTSSINI